MHLATSPRGLLNYGNPVNRQAPLNRNVALWWYVLPQRAGSPRWFDIAGTNHGTLLNGITWEGRSNLGGHGSVHCDAGSSQTITTGGELLGLSGLSKVTIGGWFYRTTTATPLSFGRDGSGIGGERFLISQFSDGITYFIAETPAFGTAYRSYADNLTGWNRIDMVFNGSLGAGNSIETYINGQVVGASTSGISPTTVYANSVPITLNIANNAWYGTGNYNDCSIHFRAFTAREIYLRYLASRTGYQQELNYSRRPFIFDMGGSAPIIEQPTGVGLSAINVPGSRILDHGNPAKSKAGLNDGLLAWFHVHPSTKGGPTAREIVRGQNFTLIGGTAWSGDAPSGMQGGSLSFDGTDDYAESTTLGQYLKEIGDGPYLIQGWIKLNATGRNDFFAWKNSGGSNDISFYTNASTMLEHHAVVGGVGGTVAIGGTALSTGVWYHVAARRTVVSGTVTNLVFLNGVDVTSIPASTAADFSGMDTNRVWLGSNHTAFSPLAGFNLDGKIADFRISKNPYANSYRASRQNYQSELNFNRRIWPLGGSDPGLPSGQTIAGTVASSQTSVIPPTVTVGTATLTPSAVTTQTTAVPPTVTAGSTSIAATATIASSQTSVIVPTVTPGTVTLTPSAVTATTTVIAPSLSAGGVISPDAIVAQSSAITPSLTLGTVTLTPDTITSVTTIIVPTASPGTVTLTPDAVTTQTTVLPPTVFALDAPQTIVMGVILSQTSAVAPTLYVATADTDFIVAFYHAEPTLKLNTKSFPTLAMTLQVIPTLDFTIMSENEINIGEPYSVVIERAHKFDETDFLIDGVLEAQLMTTGEVPIGSAVILTYVGGSRYRYKGTIPGAVTAGLTDETDYYIDVTGTIGSLPVNRRLTRKAVIGN
jgi:hypothetical protein